LKERFLGSGRLLISKLTFIWTLISIGIFIFGNEFSSEGPLPGAIESHERPDTIVIVIITKDSLSTWPELIADHHWGKKTSLLMGNNLEDGLSQELNINSVNPIKP
jgi:hypothetical protein